MNVISNNAEIARKKSLKAIIPRQQKKYIGLHKDNYNKYLFKLLEWERFWFSKYV